MTKNIAFFLQPQDAQTYFQSWSCWCNSGSSGAIVEIDLGGSAVRGPKSSMKIPAAPTSDNYTSKITQFKENIIFQNSFFLGSMLIFQGISWVMGCYLELIRRKDAREWTRNTNYVTMFQSNLPIFCKICWESFSATGIEQKPLKDLWGLLSLQGQLKKPRNLTCFGSLVIDFGVFSGFWSLLIHFSLGWYIF